MGKLSRHHWLIGIAVIIAAPTVYWLIPESRGMTVTFHNSSDRLIESINLNFGNSNTQSMIQAFRIQPDQERVLLLNHEPGMGFNVEVTYKGGIQQSFCALRGDDQTDPVIHLHP